MRGGRGASREAGWPVVVAARQEACTGKRPDSRPEGPKGTRRAHEEHAAHVCDAGGVEAQRLVEGRRALPSRREGTCDAGGRGASRQAGGPVGCGGGTQEACTGKRPDSRLGGQGHARSAR